MTPRPRPSVDVVVPFRGSSFALADLLDRLSGIQLGHGDSIVVVDNSPGEKAASRRSSEIRVVTANQRQSSYFARNRGAALGSAEWILFIDADIEPPRDLLEGYFAHPPERHTGVLAGAIVDQGPRAGETQTAAARYAFLRRSLDQQNTLRQDRPFAKTANCAVRREAFHAVAGFHDAARSGGDADLCFRLAGAGWQIEGRPDAAVTHRGRQTVLALLRQQARYGSGASWLERRYPGFGPPPLALHSILARSARGGIHLIRAHLHRIAGDRDHALVSALDPLTAVAFDLGRRVPNRSRPVAADVRARTDIGLGAMTP